MTIMRELLASSLKTAQLTADGFKDVGMGPGSTEGEYIEWLTFKDANQAVVDDVARIKAHPLVPKTIPVHGYIYDVKTGKLLRWKGPRRWERRGRSWPTALMECLPKILGR